MTTPPPAPTFVDDAARRRAASDLDTTFLVEAGAGTGKTTVLVDRLLTILKSGRGQLEQLAAITFTDKAATELRERLYLAIDAALSSAVPENERYHLREARRQFDRAPIATVHAFCAELLRERPVEARVDPDFTVLDAFAASLLRHEVWREWLAQEMERSPEVLKQALRADMKLGHVEALRDFLLEHRDSLAFLPAPVNDRIDEFARQCLGTLEKLTTCAHSCVDQTDRAYRQILALRDLAEVMEDRAAWERLLLDALPIAAKAGTKTHWKPASTLEEVRQLFLTLSESHTQARAAWGHNTTVNLVAWLNGYLRAYEEKKRARGCLDFADLLLLTRDLLKHDVTVRRYFQRRFRFLFVDEFQDTDPLQAEIVFFLAEREPRAKEWTEVALQPGKLFLVGDPQQSIYRFRRADVQVYTRVREIIARQGEELSLSTNFRTRAPALAWINQTFAREFAAGGTEQTPYRPLTEARTESTGREVILAPVPQGSEKLDRDEQRQREARAVAEFLVRTVGELGVETWGGQTITYRDVAVLCRTHKALEAYEDALQATGIPHRLAGGRRYAQRQEIAELRALLRAIESPSDTTALVATLRSSVFGFSDEELAVFVSSGGQLDYLHEPALPLVDGAAERFAAAFALLRQLHQRRTQLTPAALLTELYAQTPVLPLFALLPQGTQRVANVLKLVETARALTEQGLTTLAAFNRFLEFQEAAAQASDAPFLEEQDAAVRLLTIHQAKGLEFPVVILADATYNQRNSSRVGIVERESGRLELRIGPRDLACATLGWQEAEAQEQARDTAEERRLWYVAATRVRDHLVIPVVLPVEGTTKNLAHWAVTEELAQRLTSAEQSMADEDAAAEPHAGEFIYRLPTAAFATAASSMTTPLILPSVAHEETAAYAYREWEQARQATLAAGRQAAVICTVTALTPPEKSLDRPDEAWTSERAHDRIASLRFGRAVHAALRRASVRRAGAQVTTERIPIALTGDDAVIAQLVETTLASPVMARARSAVERFAETPFSLPYAGRLIEGVIDFAFIENGAWTIVDFKTDRQPVTEGERYAAYRAQLWLYALALERLTQRPVAELVLLFVRSQQIVTCPWGDVERRAAETVALTAPAVSESNE
jgi:ATP-dependent exoDNAse (exonuclease V) beta subunit